MFAGADNDRQLRVIALRSKELLVCRKRTISPKRSPKVIGTAIRVRIVTNIARAKLRQKVPEVFRLPAAHELLWQRGLVKTYMPERGVTQNVLPWIETRKGRVENHHAARTLWVTPCKGVRHYSPDVVAEYIDVFQAKTYGELMNVVGQVRRIVTGVR